MGLFMLFSLLVYNYKKEEETLGNRDLLDKRQEWKWLKVTEVRQVQTEASDGSVKQLRLFFEITIHNPQSLLFPNYQFS